MLFYIYLRHYFICCYFSDTLYAAKMQEQMEELDQLKTERQRLLSIQQELQTLNARFPPVSIQHHIMFVSEVEIAVIDNISLVMPHK